MAEPFDATHILDLGWKQINIDYDYSVEISTLTSGREDRNLNRARARHLFSVSWETTDFCDYELLKTAFDRANASFEGFYLDHAFFEQLIPVRFDSPFRVQTVDEECCGNWWLSIQNLQMIELLDQPLIDR
jgi:hypothetical protein